LLIGRRRLGFTYGRKNPEWAMLVPDCIALFNAFIAFRCFLYKKNAIATQREKQKRA
jgi:hypothetical protein